MVTGSATGELGQDQIVRLETPRDRPAAGAHPGRDVDPGEAAGPARGRLDGLRAHAAREIAELLMERRTVTERSVDLIGEVRPGAWVQIGLHRREHLRGRFGDRPEDRLAADDDELVLSRDVGGRRDHVLERRALHVIS